MINWISYFRSDFLLSINSVIVGYLLRMRGVRVGKGFKARAMPLVIMDETSSIIIGNNVFFKDRVELRSLKGSKLVLEDETKLDRDVRIVVTNSSTFKLGKAGDVGCYTIFNCGADVSIGSNILIAGFCYIQTSNHEVQRHMPINEQGYVHTTINLGTDCWLGGGAFILPGAELGDGVVVGANSVVNKKFRQYKIVAGSPAKEIGSR